MSLRKAVDAYCRSCVHDPLSGLGHWREQVEGCTVKKCELFQYRLFDRTLPKKPLTEAQTQRLAVMREKSLAARLLKQQEAS